MIGNIPKKTVSFRKFIKRHKKYFVFFIGIIIGIFFVLVLWKVPQWQVDQFYIPPQELAQRENEYRKTFAQIIGGIAILWGLYLTWRRIRATERNVEIALEGQITERFTRAIEQLGNNEKLAVRLGGIYALERIAKDSEKDHWTIMEVLTAYVRENAKWDETTNEQDSDNNKIKPQADIQAILTVIGRRKQALGKGENCPLNLHETDIRGADLGEAHLEGTDLRRADLKQANLREAHLKLADLGEAHLEGAILRGAHLEKAILWRADLKQADLRGAQLKWAILLEADLKEADLSGAHLEKTDLREAHLEKANLWRADLKQANLGETHLEGADLRGAHLEEAIGLTQEQIKEARIDKKTKLPDYLQELKTEKKAKVKGE